VRVGGEEEENDKQNDKNTTDDKPKHHDSADSNLPGWMSKEAGNSEVILSVDLSRENNSSFQSQKDI
jgi:hypothetical protein